MSEKRLIRFGQLQAECGHRPIPRFICLRAGNKYRAMRYSCSAEHCPIWAGLEEVGSKAERASEVHE
jgi:hypothetical protein